jgi:ribosome assembly protein YihI (activator of Der GTPase)
MFRISETNVKLKYPADELEEGKEEQSLDELWSKLDKNFSITLPFVEQTIDRWNNQTQLLGNLKQSSKKTSHFSQTIISQVNSLLA